MASPMEWRKNRKLGNAGLQRAVFFLLFLSITSSGVQRVSTSRCGVGSFFSSRQNNGNGSAHTYRGRRNTSTQEKKRRKKWILLCRFSLVMKGNNVPFSIFPDFFFLFSQNSGAQETRKVHFFPSLGRSVFSLFILSPNHLSVGASIFPFLTFLGLISLESVFGPLFSSSFLFNLTKNIP